MSDMAQLVAPLVMIHVAALSDPYCLLCNKAGSMDADKINHITTLA